MPAGTSLHARASHVTARQIVNEGLLTVTYGDVTAAETFHCGDEATLTIGLTGTVGGAVSVGGNARLGGTLALNWLPVAGDADSRFGGTYDILTYGGELDGAFSGLAGSIGEAYIAGIDHAAGVPGDADANAMRITLYDQLDGDCNVDGEVNRGDFLALRAGFGSPNANWFCGDVTFDGCVDYLDYVALKRNCGGCVPGGAAIPEPATLVLVLAAAGPVLRKRRRSDCA